MKIKFGKNLSPEKIALINQIGSKDHNKSIEAQAALATFLQPVILEVLNQAGSAANIYTDVTFMADDNPSYPLDLYYGTDVNQIQTWSQTMAGGLPSSQIEGAREMKLTTYQLHSAWHYAKKYARKSRLDVIAKAVERIGQEVLVKQERNAWAVILKALGEAVSVGSDHIITSNTQNVLSVDDISRLWTLVKRINVSFTGGTPANFQSAGLTDLYVSPEIVQQIRGFAYNPMNSVGNQSTGPIALPEDVRSAIYKNAGASEIFGVAIHDLNELGDGQAYNVLFGDYVPAGVAHSAANFNTSTDQILIGFDLTRESFLRPVAQDADSGSTFSLQPDDQWVQRADKAGFYGSLEEGRVCIDARSVVGLIV